MIQQKKYELIVIGGSVGGLVAAIEIITDLPENYAIPIVIILHRMRNNSIGTNNISHILKSKCKIKNIKEVDEKELIQKNTIYIVPANYHLLVEENKTMSLDVSELINFSRPSIDVTFETAASVYKDKLVGILLTGSNTDGSKGMQVIKDKNGLTIVQDPATAEVPVMPQAAIKLMNIDHIMSLIQIHDLLLTLQQ